jgi:hypothetical protein
MRTLILALLSIGAAPAQSLLLDSQASLVAAQAADIGSTLAAPSGTREGNPLGAKGVITLKLCTTAALFIVEHHLPRHRKIWTILNFALSAEFGAAAAHNLTIR